MHANYALTGFLHEAENAIFSRFPYMLSVRDTHGLSVIQLAAAGTVYWQGIVLRLGHLRGDQSSRQ